LYENGTLKRLFLAGLVSNKLLLYYEIYIEVKKQKKRNRFTSANIMMGDIAQKYNVSVQTVYRACKVFYQKSEKISEK